MPTPLRILLVEDSEDDAALLLRELRKGGYSPDCRRVDNGNDFESALLGKDWDIVITDHNLPSYSSTATLAAVKKSGIDIPVIIVSGSIGEEIAVAAMKNGASDYIMKDNLARLVPAIVAGTTVRRVGRYHRAIGRCLLPHHDDRAVLIPACGKTGIPHFAFLRERRLDREQTNDPEERGRHPKAPSV